MRYLIILFIGVCIYTFLIMSDLQIWVALLLMVAGILMIAGSLIAMMRKD